MQAGRHIETDCWCWLTYPPRSRAIYPPPRLCEEQRVKHRLNVLHLKEDATDRISMDEWRCWSDLDGDPPIHYAEGPCPGCGATAHGIVTRDNGPFERMRIRPERGSKPTPGVVEIFMECQCGVPHGEDGAYGCGRTWVIECPGSIESGPTS